jgi:NAD(P)-dependent dehydrogenase (short-subunit alcohol dehydrogenase family)
MSWLKTIILQYTLHAAFTLLAGCMINIAAAETVLITGSNSGIGLDFSKRYAARGWLVIATHRRDTVPDTLRELSAKYDNVRVERMDVTRFDEIDALADKLKDVPIDVLINNAAILSAGSLEDPATFSRQIIGTIDYSLFDPYMHTNALGPLKITETFLPHLRASERKTVVAISSDGGTISVWDERPGFYFYAASKIAMNMFMKRSAWDLKKDGIKVVMFHPGFVRTEKTRHLQFEGMIELDESVPGMMKIIDNLTMEDTGKFFKHTGEIQPW